MQKIEMLFQKKVKIKANEYNKMEQVMKAMEKCINDTVQLLSEKYGFNKDEAHAYLGCDKRGRPEKKAKAKINKTEMVDDVIGRLLQMGSLTPPCELPMLNKVVQKKK